MNSNHARYLTLALLVINGILAAGPITGTFPGMPSQWVPITTIAIVALGEWLKSILTPSTNAQTPDNLPSKPPTTQ